LGREFLSRETIDDPFPLYADLRANQPVARIGPSGVHPVATWALIEEVLDREEDFSANLTGVLIRGDDGEATTFPLPPSGGSHVIATADEPDHRVHRSLVQPRMSPRRVEAMEALLRDWTGEAVATWSRAGGGDVIPIAETVPARAVAHLLGLPAGDVSHFRTWAMMGGDILAGAVGQETLMRLGRETAQAVVYLGGHLDRFAASLEVGEAPGGDDPLLSSLARAVEQGKIDREQAVGIAIVMFGAGGESTAALIGSCARRLAGERSLQQSLRSDPALVPRFVEEVVRLEPPFKFHYRLVRRACELGGVALEAGDRLMLLWASANRDAEVFEEPDALKLDRRFPKHHMGFGRGSHFCVGATLARLEARLVVEALLGAGPDLRIRSGSRPVYASSIFVRRLERLELDFGS